MTFPSSAERTPEQERLAKVMVDAVDVAVETFLDALHEADIEDSPEVRAAITHFGDYTLLEAWEEEIAEEAEDEDDRD